MQPSEFRQVMFDDHPSFVGLRSPKQRDWLESNQTLAEVGLRIISGDRSHAAVVGSWDRADEPPHAPAASQ
eukprot:11224054-Lingulodinium_polyedra.AAC.1